MHFPCKSVLIGTVVSTVVTGCWENSGGSALGLHDVVVVEREFRLDENDVVLNVAPLVSVDPLGGFLIADSREAQVRRYGDSGQLLWHAGSRGGGPGQFTQPRVAVRAHDHTVVVFEQDGRVTVFDSAGSRVLHTFRTDFRFVEDAEVLNGGRFLLAAIHREGLQGPRIHLWNLGADTVLESFFAPMQTARNPVAATIAGWTKFAVRGDTVAAIFALSDSVHLFSVRGEPRGTVPIPFEHFRPVGARVPEGGNDPVQRERWLTSFDYVADIHWLAGGDLLVPYQNVIPGGAYTRDWHLTRMTRTGDRIFELRHAPRLLAVDYADGLYFIAPGAEEPNRWIYAALQ